MGVHYKIILVGNSLFAGNSEDVIDEISDTEGVVDDDLFPVGVQKNLLLQYIDSYGTTVFNGLQCNVLFSEISNINFSSPNKLVFIDRLLKMLRTAADGVHLSVIFLGD